MTDLVHVACVGPVRHVPARSREQRVSFARMDVPVRLRELSWSETGEGPAIPVATGPRIIRTRLLGGDPWRVIGHDDFRPGRTKPRHLDPEGFRAWLTGEGAPRDADQSETIRCLCSTPLGARIFSFQKPFRVLETWNMGRQGRVLNDQRPEAEAALVRLFREDLALVGGVPMMRLRGPVAQLLDAGTRLAIPRHPDVPVGYGPMSQYYRVDRAEALVARLGIEAPATEWVHEAVEGIRHRGDEDVAMSLHEGLRHLMRQHVPDAWEGRRLAGLDDELRDAAAAASVGILRDDDLVRIADLVMRTIAVDAARPGKPNPLDGHLARYVEAVARPILADRCIDLGEDAEQLAGLAP